MKFNVTQRSNEDQGQMSMKNAPKTCQTHHCGRILTLDVGNG